MCVVAAKYTIVPIRRGDGTQLHVKDAGSLNGVSVLGDRRVWGGGEVRFALERCREREVVVEVRRGGRPCTQPVVELVL
jgi:hypothetical protein